MDAALQLADELGHQFEIVQIVCEPQSFVGVGTPITMLLCKKLCVELLTDSRHGYYGPFDCLPMMKQIK